MNTDKTTTRTNATGTGKGLKLTLLMAGATMIASSAVFAGAAHAHNTPKTTAPITLTVATTAAPSISEIVTASPTAVVSFDRVKVEAIDTTPKKPESISVMSATQTIKRPLPGTLSAPLENMVPTSSFGKRVSPITGAPDEDHLGQDFGGPCGTEVFASDSGVVVFAGWHDHGGGNRVEVDHGNGLVTTYNHMESNSVAKGDVIDVGAVVGKMGTTGSSTGCHLHFETIKKEERHVDPMGWTLIPIVKK